MTHYEKQHTKVHDCVDICEKQTGFSSFIGIQSKPSVSWFVKENVSEGSHIISRGKVSFTPSPTIDLLPGTQSNPNVDLKQTSNLPETAVGCGKCSDKMCTRTYFNLRQDG